MKTCLIYKLSCNESKDCYIYYSTREDMRLTYSVRNLQFRKNKIQRFNDLIYSNTRRVDFIKSFDYLTAGEIIYEINNMLKDYPNNINDLVHKKKTTNKKMYSCPCGSVINVYYKNYHKLSTKHKNYEIYRSK